MFPARYVVLTWRRLHIVTMTMFPWANKPKQISEIKQEHFVTAARVYLILIPLASTLHGLVFVFVQRSPGKTGSHFNPKSPLFVPGEKKDILTSTACYAAMAAVLAGGLLSCRVMT